MGYELHIDDRMRFLAYDDWIAAVESTPGVRIATGDMVTKHPIIGAVSSWKLPEGTAEMCFDGEWIPVFYWHGGSVTFKLGDAQEQVLQAALHIAAQLGVRVRGDRGEIYTCIKDLYR